MLDDYRNIVTQVVTLWAVLDPIGHLPLFLGTTGALDKAGRRRAAILSVALAFVILAVFSLAGQFLLHAMGISLLSFQIAGGITVFLFATSMVLGEAEPSVGVDASRHDVTSLAIYPLATPIIAGPGAMLTMILLMDNNRHSLSEQTSTLASLALVLTVLLVVFLMGETVRRVIGAAGTNVLRRIRGLILAALAVNMVLSAIALWLHLPGI
jgi:multiple antibiotic resistance protein